MTVAVEAVDRKLLLELLQKSKYIQITKDELQKMRAILTISHEVYIGLVKDELACCWGLIPPVLLSDRAYIWLYSSELVEANKFLFVRHSQRWVEWALETYPEIIGFCELRNVKAIRWIEWMGGEFKRPYGDRADFVIRRKDGRSIHANCG